MPAAVVVAGDPGWTSRRQPIGYGCRLSRGSVTRCLLPDGPLCPPEGVGSMALSLAQGGG